MVGPAFARPAGARILLVPLQSGLVRRAHSQGILMSGARGTGVRHKPIASPACDPAIRVSECSCSTYLRDTGLSAAAWRRHVEFPSCQPTVACGLRNLTRRDSQPFSTERRNAAIVLVFHHDNATVRYWHIGRPFHSYLHTVRLAIRVVLSLRAVATTLPVKLLLSGERYPMFEEQFTAMGVDIINATPYSVFTTTPPWANRHFLNSFHKLALTQFRRVIVLDCDAYVYRNIDHLSGAPAPAFVFRPTPCFEGLTLAFRKWEMNSGVMVLAPTVSELTRIRTLTSSPRRYNQVGHGTDPSDQSVWRHFYSDVHELPRAYNMMIANQMSPFSEWERTIVLHDIEAYQKRFRLPASPPLQATFERHDVESRAIVNGVCSRHSLACRV